MFIYEIGEKNGLHAYVSDFGCLIQSLAVRLRNGDERDIVLGYDTPEEYERSETFFGMAIGPLADRVSGGEFMLGPDTVKLERNAGNDSMHSGRDGFHRRIWEVEETADGILLFAALKDAPLPGTLDVRICYRIINNDTFRIEYDAVCNQDTVLSLTNHSYFNLNGCGNCLDDLLTVFASSYAQTTCTPEAVATGKTVSVTNTPFDIRRGKTIREVIGCKDFMETESAGGIDHYFIPDGSGFRRQARLDSADGEISLICSSDTPGLLIYSGNGLDNEKGKDGRIYNRNAGIAFETEQFPNAVNIPPVRPQVCIKAGEHYRSVTEFRVEIHNRK